MYLSGQVFEWSGILEVMYLRGHAFERLCI